MNSHNKSLWLYKIIIMSSWFCAVSMVNMLAKGILFGHLADTWKHLTPPDKLNLILNISFLTMRDGAKVFPHPSPKRVVLNLWLFINGTKNSYLQKRLLKYSIDWMSKCCGKCSVLGCGELRGWGVGHVKKGIWSCGGKNVIEQPFIYCT